MITAISGGSGKLGRQVADLVLAKSAAADVVITTRDPAVLSELSTSGVQVRRADYDDESSLAAAFRGVDTLFMVSTNTVGGPEVRVRQHQRAIKAAAEAGVGHLVYTSVARVEAGNPLALAPDHMATEVALRTSGITYTSLRNNVYSDGVPQILSQAIVTGKYLVNSGAGGTAYITRGDCARAAAAVLLGDRPETSSVKELSGPSAVTADELAALTATLVGRPIEVIQLDDEEYVHTLTAAGFPEPAARVFASFGQAAREGWLDLVTPTVAELTGKNPIPVRDVLAAALTSAPARD